MLTITDHSSIEQRGMTVAQIKAQMAQLCQGIPPIPLNRPCTVGDGIVQLSSNDCSHYQAIFAKAQQAGRISKFVPASGAATRMFKDLLRFIQESVSTPMIQQAWTRIEDFPFIDTLKNTLHQNGTPFEQLYHNNAMQTVFQALVSSPGLNYSQLPKAVLLFHRYSDGSRTALEEHLREALDYALPSLSGIPVHLTISPQHEQNIRATLHQIQHKFERADRNVPVSLSQQKTSTDTIALDEHQDLFRDQNGHLVFRPGGHGALLENLNDGDADIVLISNIDNVAPDHLRTSIIDWRMALGGYLIEQQEAVFSHLRKLEYSTDLVLEQTEVFIKEQLHQSLPQSYDELAKTKKLSWLRQFLDRPIRVCGMVRNTSDPGGGPFWVQHSDGFQSRQIVEQSQADPNSTSQQKLFREATHFNPVDLVCGVRNHQGNSFDLLQFRDPNTSFISSKSYQGRSLKALEWPGLWNGGMADWITLFVEMPRSTFNPVKTFMDWLDPSHQPPT